MSKSRWDESFDSFLRSYIDPQRVEELRETRAEIDGKVKTILKSLAENNEGSKETATGFIEDLNNHYQSLYSSYDHLIEKLSGKSRGRNEKDSCSSSDSSDKSGKKNGGAQNSTTVIEQELGTVISEVGELRRKSGSTLDETDTLYLDYETALSENVGLKLEVNKLNEEITRLDEYTEELKAELEMKADEICTLIENLRITEVSQRLTSRKLHVTEQMLCEKEENHQKKVENLEEELKSLAAYKEFQVKTEREVSEKVTELFSGIENLSMKFEEDYDRLELRVYKIVNELKFVVNWVAVNNSEKDRLKNELAGLLQQLKEKKELEMILQHEEDEKKSSIQTVRQLEGKVSEMEMKVKEMDIEMRGKDNRILSLCEEKKEAIRQLCIWSDYQRNRIRTRHVST